MLVLERTVVWRGGEFLCYTLASRLANRTTIAPVFFRPPNLGGERGCGRKAEEGLRSQECDQEARCGDCLSRESGGWHPESCLETGYCHHWLFGIL